MRAFVAGLLLGALVAVAVMWTGSGQTPRTTARSEVELGTPAPTGDTPHPKPASTRPTAPPGYMVLGIGEGFVFGEQTVRAASGECDFVCQDIRHGASVHAQHGIGEAALPLGAVGLPRHARTLAARIWDAPLDFPEHDLWLTLVPNARKTGVGLVRAADGSVYRIYLDKVTPSPNALERYVTIGYEMVPTMEGGGVARVPTPGKEPVASTDDIKKLVAVGRSVPGDTFARHLAGKYVAIPPREPKLDLETRLFVYEPNVFDRWVRFRRRGALFAASGIGVGGHVVLDSYSAVAAGGEMAGTIDVKSYGFVHIAGDLTGTVNVNSYATVVIDGDLIGTLKVRSYTKLLLRGQVRLGKLDMKGSCWSDFYFESYHSRADLEKLGVNARSVTLHVKQSDLRPGKQTQKIGDWREVIVGGDVWTKIRAR